MNELLELNRKFLINGYLWISGILSIGFSVYLFFFYSEVSSKWILIIYSLTLIVLPLFILSVWISDWFRKRRYKKRILTKKPYSELEKIGFTKKTIKTNHNSLVDYVQFAEINGSEIIFDINIRKPKIAEFSIYGLTNHLNSKEYLQKAKELDYLKIDFSRYAFTKSIDTKKEKLNSIQELEKILMELTHIAKKEKYEPISITETKPVSNTV
ncbi:hypothetical protein ES677_05080 [Bizionia gelidisalsuginis]|uniref:Uncharacterized protein n=1 Tax=Bizionia gelidisalsuginis TaxID=291188 RepID=A0ABY3MBU6_9FLAO|nr:hypothetical protein [Bizionia gelidisalsuginis]TYC14754.1 hypothetical protein ES677_05080 [Bizionia gelidisalsuginis]